MLSDLAVHHPPPQPRGNRVRHTIFSREIEPVVPN
ncbi:hypothetical protein H4W33_006519 [Kibdelosporangium phytohabitans]|nr:hypothetical protein [Kibdelosporangium phytohabitans]